MNTPPSSQGKAALVWILGWVLEISSCLAAGLARVVRWIWPGFRER